MLLMCNDEDLIEGTFFLSRRCRSLRLYSIPTLSFRLAQIRENNMN